MLDKVIEKITAQQAGKEGTAVFACGEQLKDICRASDQAAEIVLQDLDNPDMSIDCCEKKIKALADERHKKLRGNSAFVSPAEAEEIIRKFYGIPEPSPAPIVAPSPQEKVGGFIDLDDYL